MFRKEPVPSLFERVRTIQDLINTFSCKEKHFYKFQPTGILAFQSMSAELFLIR